MARDYQYQGLADNWRDFVATEHSLVQIRVKRFLLDVAGRLVDANTDALQADKAIVETMENLLNEVNSLPNWNIPWRKT